MDAKEVVEIMGKVAEMSDDELDCLIYERRALLEQTEEGRRILDREDYRNDLKNYTIG